MENACQSNSPPGYSGAVSTVSPATGNSATGDPGPGAGDSGDEPADDPARLLLLDEVTSALDPELVTEVIEVLGELRAEGMTMVLATHEMSFARSVADQVCFLDGGAIVERGDPKQVFGEPREQRTREFLQRIQDAGRLP